MPEMNRTIEELLVDYADALRDGDLPNFLKSLTRQEARSMICSERFWEATDIVRVLNGVGFSDRSVKPDVNLFISRVDAEIASRIKKARSPKKGRSASGGRCPGKTEETEKSI